MNQPPSPVPQSDVQSPPSTETPVAPVVEEPKGSSSSVLKYLLVFLGAVLLVAVTAGITYWFMNRDNLSVSDEEEVAEGNVITEEIEDSDVGESDGDSEEVDAEPVDLYEEWMTFSNDVLGITFRYPSEWEYTETEVTSGSGQPKFEFESSSGNVILSLTPYFGPHGFCSPLSESGSETIEVNGIEEIFHTCDDGEETLFLLEISDVTNGWEGVGFAGTLSNETYDVDIVTVKKVFSFIDY